MKTLPLRVLSALIALGIALGIYNFFQVRGVFWIGFLLVTLGAYEYSKISFSPLKLPPAFRIVFFIFNLAILLLSLSFFSDIPFAAALAVLLSCYFSLSLWLLKNKFENPAVLQALLLSSLGFFYCALLPSFALSVLLLPAGNYWFLLLLGLVFFGDTFAYFGGVWFGKTKLMPNVSPNKTVAGAVSGLLGSIIGTLLVSHYLFPNIHSLAFFALAAIGAGLAQSGDLFESLIKRVANIKDSGQIMPGHGGVLDRLDGLYFAAPVVYAAALVFGH